MIYNKFLLITIILLTSPSESRFTNLRCGKRNQERRDCILYDKPSKENCDTNFPNRMTIKEYKEFNRDIGIGWLIMMLGILTINLMKCKYI